MGEVEGPPISFFFIQMAVEDIPEKRGRPPLRAGTRGNY
jgi:hypothetical protein